MSKHQGMTGKWIVHAYCVPEQMNDWSDEWGGACDVFVCCCEDDALHQTIAFQAQGMPLAVMERIH